MTTTTDQTPSSIDTDLLTRKLRNAEKSIEFLQNEHSTRLNELHGELTKWQEKYSDLSFRSAMQNVSDPSVEYQKLQKKLKQQEKELRQLKTTISTLEKTIQNEDEIFRSFDKKIGEMNEKHALELHMQTVKQRELEKELDQRGFMITKLTDQLQREKEQRRKLNRVPIIGQMILPDKPLKMKSKDESIRRPTQLHRNSSNRSSSLNIRDNRDDETIELLLLRRRPPTPPQQLRSPSILSSTSNHQSISTPRQRLETKLPPIAIRKMPLKASPGSLVQQNAEL